MIRNIRGNFFEEKVAPRGFEPRSTPPKGAMIVHYIPQKLLPQSLPRGCNELQLL